jgi:hypothetical protein
MLQRREQLGIELGKAGQPLGVEFGDLLPFTINEPYFTGVDGQDLGMLSSNRCLLHGKWVLASMERVLIRNPGSAAGALRKCSASCPLFDDFATGSVE